MRLILKKLSLRAVMFCRGVHIATDALAFFFHTLERNGIASPLLFICYPCAVGLWEPH